MASLLVGDDGRVVDVVVLDAPDWRIADAMRRAALQWRFDPRDDERFITKLIYHFDVQVGDVVNAAEPLHARLRRESAASRASGRTIGSFGDPAANGVVLDVRDRAAYRRSRGSALNIPLAELASRVQALWPDARIIPGTVTLDCRHIPTADCEMASLIVHKATNRQARVLPGGS